MPVGSRRQRPELPAGLELFAARCRSCGPTVPVAAFGAFTAARSIAEYINSNDSKVILLSATPYNKTYLDLSNQLRLFIDENDVLYAADSESNTERNPGVRRGIYSGDALTGEVRTLSPEEAAAEEAADRVGVAVADIPGGISPELIRSRISAHCGVFSCPTFRDNVSIRKSASCFTAPWQRKQ